MAFTPLCNTDIGQYLLTHVSSMTFHLEPQEALFTLFNTTEVQVSKDISFSENTSERSFLLRKLLIVMSAEKGSSLATDPTDIWNVSNPPDDPLFSRIVAYLVHHAFLIQ